MLHMCCAGSRWCRQCFGAMALLASRCRSRQCSPSTAKAGSLIPPYNLQSPAHCFQPALDASRPLFLCGAVDYDAFISHVEEGVQSLCASYGATDELSCSHAGLMTGLVVDIGDGVTHIIPVIQGCSFPHLTKYALPSWPFLPS